MHVRWGKLLQQPAGASDDPERRTRARATFEQFGESLPQLRQDIATLVRQSGEDVAGLTDADRAAQWARLQRRTRQLITLLTQMFVIQTQIRVNLIELPAVEAPEDEALRYALTNRLDLMNVQGRVVDAWRKVTVAANGLLPDLNVLTTVSLGTEPGCSSGIS